MATTESAATHPDVGLSLDELDTPALCLDVDVLDANIKHMMELCREHGIDWRPHSKAHKCPDIAKREVAAGALGITCAKLGEAEVFAAAGIRDLLIANQIVGPAKVRRLIELTKVADPIVAVDHVRQIEPIADAARAAGVTVRMIVEVDIGLERAGVPSHNAVELGRQIDAAEGVRLDGIMGYEGHLLQVPDAAEKEASIRAAMRELEAVKEAFEKAGLPCPIVSAGGTGSFRTTITCPGVTELQAGGLIFMDNYYRNNCQVDDFDFALTVIATIVSRPTPDRAIIDAGRKTQHIDFAPATVVGRDDVRVARLSAEHGWVELAESARQLHIGDRLRMVPGYTDFTTVLHNEFHIVRGDQVIDVWPLAGRGRLR